MESGKRIIPTIPTKKDYIFSGWYTDEGLTQVFDSKVAITKNLILHAKWAREFTVTFNTYGLILVPDVVVVEGGKVGRPEDPVSDNLPIFEGWYKDEDLTQVFDFGVETITANTKLYAKWALEGTQFLVVTTKEAVLPDAAWFTLKVTKDRKLQIYPPNANTAQKAGYSVASAGGATLTIFVGSGYVTSIDVLPPSGAMDGVVRFADKDGSSEEPFFVSYVTVSSSLQPVWGDAGVGKTIFTGSLQAGHTNTGIMKNADAGLESFLKFKYVPIP